MEKLWSLRQRLTDLMRVRMRGQCCVMSEKGPKCSTRNSEELLPWELSKDEPFRHSEILLCGYLNSNSNSNHSSRL